MPGDNGGGAMGRTGQVVTGLAAGLALGLLARTLPVAGLQRAVLIIGVTGQLWLNALQMTLVPLIFCLMADGIGGIVRQASAGRLIALTLGLFWTLSFAAALSGAVVTSAWLHVFPVAANAGLIAHGFGTQPAPPGFFAQVLALIPINPIAAAAQAAWLPLIVFASILGAAAASVGEDCAILFRLFKAMADALLLIVEWVLWLAPAGVFMLACGAALQVGAGLAAALALYVILLSMALVCAVALAIGIGMVGAGVPVRAFLGALSGPLAIAASTQSSMASLPALLKAAREDLRLPDSVTSAVMPLAVSTFRFGNVFGSLSAGLIGAHLCGLHPGALQIVMASAIAVLTNIGVIGLPGAAVLFAAYGPVFAVLGTPLDMIALLIPVFTLPDILDTSANVSADMSVTAIVARLAGPSTQAALTD